MIRNVGIKTYTVAEMKAFRGKNLRSMSRAQVEKYKRVMRLNRWRPGASTISFTESGELGDGFQRVQAAIELGLPFSTSVNVDAEPADIAAMDQGRKRGAPTMGKVLGMKSNALDLAVALKYGLQMKVAISDDERLELRIAFDEPIEFVTENFKRIPLASKLVFAEEYLRIRNSPAGVKRLAEMGKVMRTNVPVRPGVVDYPALKLAKYISRTNFADNSLRSKCTEMTVTALRKFMKQ